MSHLVRQHAHHRQVKEPWIARLETSTKVRSPIAPEHARFPLDEWVGLRPSFPIFHISLASHILISRLKLKWHYNNNNSNSKKDRILLLLLLSPRSLNPSQLKNTCRSVPNDASSTTINADARSRSV